MKIYIIIFIILFLVIYGGLNYYIGVSILNSLGKYISFNNTKIYWSIFWFISTSYIIFQLLGKFLPNFISSTLNYIGIYWMAIMFYLILILPILDILRLLNNKFRFLPADSNIISTSMLVIVLSFFMFVIFYGNSLGKNSYVKEYDISIDKEFGDIENLKTVMISDLHLGNIIGNGRIESIVNEINDLKPDIVLIAGDIVDSDLLPFVKNNMAQKLKNIESKYGVYAALGNHDLMVSNLDELMDNLKHANINVLRDEAVLINNSFYVVGRDDYMVERNVNSKRKKLNEILEHVNKSKPIIVIDHQPKNLIEVQNEEVDIQVSGHTHRGQLLPINLITSAMFEIDYGHLVKDKSNIIVSSGYGTWGPPIRLGSKSEIVLIKINKKDK